MVTRVTALSGPRECHVNHREAGSPARRISATCPRRRCRTARASTCWPGAPSLFLLAIGDFTTVVMWSKFGGRFGIATALAAWCAAFAGVTNATFKTVLPVFSLAPKA